MSWRQAGISLIELVMFIVIVSIGIVGLLYTLNTATRNSADPMLRKQALAIAESMLEEIELMPFTFCDPDDQNAGLNSTVSAANCQSSANDQNNGGGTLGPQSGETRYSSSTPFDNVADYNGFAMNSGIYDITNTAVTGLGSYKLSVNISRAALSGLSGSTTLGSIASDGTALLITVTVTDPTGQAVSLQGMRTRYAPTTLP